MEKYARKLIIRHRKSEKLSAAYGKLRERSIFAEFIFHDNWRMFFLRSSSRRKWHILVIFPPCEMTLHAIFPPCKMAHHVVFPALQNGALLGHFFFLLRR